MAWVATDMNAGVDTLPWGVTSSPALASPSVCCNWKEKPKGYISYR